MGLHKGAVLSKLSGILILGLSLVAFNGCDSDGGGGLSQSFGSSGMSVGESCQGSGKLCLGVRFVSYKNSAGKAVVSDDLAAANIRTTNEIYDQCGIAFQVDEYQAVDPTTYGLAYGSQSVNQLDRVRETFGYSDELLVVYTGPWGTTKNAWTAMPGNAPYGAIHEASIADYPNILAHELGHYLGLDHSGNTSNLLSTIIYPSSTQLSDSQCATMRATANNRWGAMKR